MPRYQYLAGLRQRIGNGSSTPIWGSAWLTLEGSGRILTCRPIAFSFPNMVSDLIDIERGVWYMDRLHTHFWPCDIPIIIQVPLGTSETPDITYWFLVKHGKFTVRSCYYHILEQNVSSNLSSSSMSLSVSSQE